MPETPKYQSKVGNALDKLYQEWDERLCQTGGMWGGLWLGLRIEVPSLLQMLDRDEGAQREMMKFVVEFAKELESDIGTEDQDL